MFEITDEEGFGISLRVTLTECDEKLEGDNQSMWIEEQKKNANRVVNEELHNDTKLSVCRSSGEGSSRVGKRKITWQDQVDQLRV
jgi:hypothetical protein